MFSTMSPLFKAIFKFYTQIIFTYASVFFSAECIKETAMPKNFSFSIAKGLKLINEMSQNENIQGVKKLDYKV